VLAGWAPDGKRVAFGGFNSDLCGLWSYDIETKTATLVAKGTYSAPAWSPDGKRLSFDFRQGDDENNHIWLVDTEGRIKGQ
jgi:Tol biopolymer transport system component